MNVRIARLAGRGVLLISALLVAVEIGRVGLVGSTLKTTVAILAAGAFLPLHLWHLSYGVRGERPPHAAPTLAAIAVINLVALVVIGVSWSFMLAVLATSALIVLRAPWSLAVLAACVLTPLVASWVEPDQAAGFAHTTPYLMYSILFRAAIQFAVVWLVAAAHQLAASRTALAAEAVLEERGRLQGEVRASLDGHVAALGHSIRRARAAIARPGVAEPLVALDAILAQADAALGDLRTIVAQTRQRGAEHAAAALASNAAARRTPVGRSLATRRAWWILASVHAIVLLFPLLMVVNAFDLNMGPHRVLAALAWAGLAALALSTSLAVARGRRPSHPLVRVAAATALAFGPLGAFGGAWETAGWVPAITAVLCLRGRWRIAAALAALAAMISYDTATTFSSSNPSAYSVAWGIAYWLVVSGLAVAGVSASARLVPFVVDLDAAQAALAARAVRSERHRVSRDLHDVLGQSLTAISLKGDLARRLIDSDRLAATQEIAQLQTIASTLVGEIDAVTRDERAVALRTEAETAVDLLKLAGIDVDVQLHLDSVAADTSAALGWAIREGTTNILRHSDARRCTIRGTRENGLFRLDLVNDRAHGARAGGTGLLNLSDRLAALDGRASCGPIGDGHFRLRVEVPV
jgi:signal transduction histidine kinase